jgi:hypothetical protein
MTTLRPSSRAITPDLVRVEIGKGCVLYLTRTEYANGICRGKVIKRREQRRQRAATPPTPTPVLGNRYFGAPGTEYSRCDISLLAG